MPKRRKTPAERPEPRAPMTSAEIATAAFGLSLIQAKDDGADVYEALVLLTLELLATLVGRDPAGFDALLNGLGVYARMRSAELMAAFLAGQPASPLGWMFDATRVH